jgi:hypothetical protein
MVCSVCDSDGHDLENCAYTPYIRDLQRLLMSYCLPVWFVNEQGRRAHGSMTVVDTGDQVIGITARHVADRIIECCTAGLGQICQIGSALLPSDSLIARHPDLDLATFRLSHSLVAAAGRQAAHVTGWPPSSPQLREVVLFGGYPGIYRRADESKGLFEADFASFAAPVTDVSDRSFSMEIPLSNSFSVSDTLIPPRVDLAGASGGGVFRLVETQSKNGIVASLYLGGIIYFGSPGLEILNAHPISALKPNGEFR